MIWQSKFVYIISFPIPKKNYLHFLKRYVECDGQTIFQYLLELEDKNLVKHLDHDGEQWTRVIVSPEEEDTHSSSNNALTSFISNFYLFLQKLFCINQSQNYQVHFDQQLR
jgi:hypothetical protein